MRKLVIALTATTALATATVAACGAARPHARHAAAAASGHSADTARSASTTPAWTAASRPATISTVTPTAIGTGPRQIPPDKQSTACSPCSTTSRAAAPARSSSRRRGGPDSKIGNFYASFIDEARVESRGHRADPALARRDPRPSSDGSQWAAELGRNLRRGIRGPFGAESTATSASRPR